MINVQPEEPRRRMSRPIWRVIIVCDTCTIARDQGRFGANTASEAARMAVLLDIGHVAVTKADGMPGHTCVDCLRGWRPQGPGSIIRLTA